MTYEEYLAIRKRIDWLRSQQKWHKKRFGDWHKNQANHYNRQIKGAWRLVNFSDIVGFTLRYHAKSIAENIVSNNPFFERMKLK